MNHWIVYVQHCLGNVFSYCVRGQVNLEWYTRDTSSWLVITNPKLLLWKLSKVLPVIVHFTHLQTRKKNLHVSVFVPILKCTINSLTLSLSLWLSLSLLSSTFPSPSVIFLLCPFVSLCLSLSLSLFPPPSPFLPLFLSFSFSFPIPPLSLSLPVPLSSLFTSLAFFLSLPPSPSLFLFYPFFFLLSHTLFLCLCAVIFQWWQQCLLMCGFV